MSLKLGKFSLKIVNGSTIELISDVYVEETKINNEITEIRIKEHNIKISDTFTFDLSGVKTSYTITYISKVVSRNGKETYLLHTELRNKATYYVMPLLELLNVPVKHSKSLEKPTVLEISKYCFNTYLINCYIGSFDGNVLDGYLYLKFRYSSHPTYQLLETLLQDHYLFIESIDDKEFTYFKFKIPRTHIEDVSTFLDGGYSKLSQLLKNKIILFFKLDKKSTMYQILHKGDEYRKQLEERVGGNLEGLELETIPTKENELIVI
jgi:hypothetical protein